MGAAFACSIVTADHYKSVAMAGINPKHESKKVQRAMTRACPAMPSGHNLVSLKVFAYTKLIRHCRYQHPQRHAGRAEVNAAFSRTPC
jgi:hypothetical protein